MFWPHGKKDQSTIKPMDDDGVFSKDHKKKKTRGEIIEISSHQQIHTVNQAFFPHTQRKHPSQNAATCWCFATNNAQNHSNQRPGTKDRIDDIRNSLPQLFGCVLGKVWIGVTSSQNCHF